MIEDLGFAVIAAADGHEALELLKRDGPRIRLVLSDIAMPRMTGVDLVKAAHAANIAVPIVLMTGNPSPGLVDALPREVPVLTKPLSEKALKDLLGAD